jgi:predicted esterase
VTPRILRSGPAPSAARAAFVLVHGRGASAEDIMSVAAALDVDDVAWIAPQAPGNTWYPLSFLAPMERNEPNLSASLAMIGEIVARLEADGVSRDRIGLLGFSQGACLSLEFAARNASKFGGIIGFSGGLIGPPGTPRDYGGSFDGTPVFLGCSDIDPHIPLERVQETSVVLRRMGANVDERIYPRMGHTINEDEIKAAQEIVRSLKSSDFKLRRR